MIGVRQRPFSGPGATVDNQGFRKGVFVGQTKYVVVCSDGTSYDLARRAPFTEWGKTKKPQYDLQVLLAQGWLPVRESAMGGGEHLAYALVLLAEGASG